MSDIKQPQDRKSKVTLYEFDHNGRTFSLPLASEGAANVPGRLTRDAIMQQDDEMAQMRLGFALLEACGASEDALAAMYEKPTTEMVETLGAWMQHGDGQGTSLPQS